MAKRKEKKISTASAVGHGIKGLLEMAGRASTGQGRKAAKQYKRGSTKKVDRATGHIHRTE